MGISNSRRLRHPSRQAGITLTETMITLAIASILLTAAVPPMQDFITRNRMSTEVNTFIASLHLARSEAVKRMQNVIMCPTTDFTACASASDWAPGWMVFSVVDGENVILQRNASLPSRFQAAGTNINPIAFGPTGALANAGGGFGNTTITFRDCENVANTRTVVLSQEGRVRTTQLTTSGGCPSG